MLIKVFFAVADLATEAFILVSVSILPTIQSLLPGLRVTLYTFILVSLPRTVFFLRLGSIRRVQADLLLHGPQRSP